MPKNPEDKWMKIEFWTDNAPEAVNVICDIKNKFNISEIKVLDNPKDKWIEEKVDEFNNMFWLTRIPKNTKQAKEVQNWLRQALHTVYTQGKADALKEVVKEVDKMIETAVSTYELNTHSVLTDLKSYLKGKG